MMKALKGLSLFGGLAVVLTLFFVIGCSNNPVQPLDSDPLGTGRPVLSKWGGTSTEGLEVFDSEYIYKSTGGTIEIQRGDFLHEFVVEAGALEENTLITVRTINEVVLGKEMIVFEFGPDGLQFSKSSKLRFDLAELNPSASAGYLYYYDPALRSWKLLNFANVGLSGVVEFNIDHFSKYAISD